MAVRVRRRRSPHPFGRPDRLRGALPVRRRRSLGRVGGLVGRRRPLWLRRARPHRRDDRRPRRRHPLRAQRRQQADRGHRSARPADDGDLRRRRSSSRDDVRRPACRWPAPLRRPRSRSTPSRRWCSATTLVRWRARRAPTGRSRRGRCLVAHASSSSATPTCCRTDFRVPTSCVPGRTTHAVASPRSSTGVATRRRRHRSVAMPPAVCWSRASTGPSPRMPTTAVAS